MASLYHRVICGGTGPASEGLVSRFERALLRDPWADPDLPSLVYQGPAGGIAGFQAAYPRRLTLDGRPVRMVSCGQLVADPDAGTLGIGGLLMRRMLAGRQDLTTTDGATGEVQAMWSRLGGSLGGLTCIGWTRVLRAGRLAVHVAASHRGRARSPADHGRAPAATDADELTPGELMEQMARVPAKLRPAYDVEFLEWLFAEMEAVEGRGPLARRVVRGDRGQVLGWYVAYLPARGIAQAIGLGSTRPDAGPVLDRLFADARAAGCSAVRGRAEPAILPALTSRRCLLRRTEWALVHYADDEVAAAAGRGQSLLTRLDGEWWMGYHLTPGRQASAFR